MTTFRLTLKRKEILETLKKSGTIMSAHVIQKKNPTIDLVTVYRNLDLFVQKGIVRKILVSGTESAYEHKNDEHHHAVCDTCHEVLHIRLPKKFFCNVEGIEHFEEETLDVIIRGKCKK